VSDSSNPEPSAEAAWPERLDHFLSHYVRESALWPVLFAIAAHVVVVLAAAMIHLARDLSPFAGLVVLLCLAASVKLARHSLCTRRRGWAVVVGLTWISAIALAWVADATGVY
jgi:hypothetical protein